jgi:hypothetical protein
MRVVLVNAIGDNAENRDSCRAQNPLRSCPISETREWEAIMKVMLFQASEGASGHEPALGVQPKVVFRPAHVYFNEDTCSPPPRPATSISLASLFDIASANELKSSTTIRKELGPPITFCL